VRTRLYFADRNATGRVADPRQHLEQVNRMHVSTIEALAHAVNANGWCNAQHIRRVQTRAIELASRLGNADPALDLFDVDAVALRSALAIPCQGPGDARAVMALYSSRTEAFTAHRRTAQLGGRRGRQPVDRSRATSNVHPS
jgi:hypothetical protein